MIITAYKTHKILQSENLFEILDKYLPHLQEKSVVAIASKIIGMCEGRVVKKESEEQKDELIRREAEYYLPEKHLGFLLTIKQNLLVVAAGIDESNSNGFLSLWPEDPQKSVNEIREHLVNKHKRKNLGIIMTDSKLSPLRLGVTGYTLAHSGFSALNSYVGKPDVFGRIMQVEKLNVSDSLSSAAITVMGEGAEQQPIAVINEMPFVIFQDRNPTQEELDALKIKFEDDIYSSLLTAVKWKKGGK